MNETAAVLKTSEQIVLRDWRLARAWLEREMESVTGRAMPESRSGDD